MQKQARAVKAPPKPAPKPLKSTPKPVGTVSASQDRTWLRRFWIILIFGAIFSASLVFLQNYGDGKKSKIEDAYIAIAVRTLSGSNFNVLCKLNLLVNSDQEEALNQYRNTLEVLISATLSGLYQGTERPRLEDVQRQLRRKINDRLPDDLQVRDVLIEQLLVGNS